MKYEIREVEEEPLELLYSCGLFGVGKRMKRKVTILEAFLGDKPIGCIEYTFFQKGENTGLIYKPRFPGNGVSIERIAVAEEWRNNGIGRELVEACVRDAKIADKNNDFLFAIDVDPYATKFLEKCGFRLDTSRVYGNEEVIYGVRYIGRIEPEFFLREGDLEERKEYWRKRKLYI